MTFFQKLFRSLPSAADDYTTVITRTADMVRQGHANQLVRHHGLNLLDLTWEDTGRFKGSCVGPNISDMTIQVRHRDRTTCMPVIRYANFSDKTADVALDDVFVRVGNETGSPLRRVSLRSYLRDLRRHLSKPDSWSGSRRSLLAPRDREVLVSAQACFLPVPTEGEATFNPVLFNYQSHAGAPAVLAIVASREGTSATIIDNQRDGFSSGAAWGQRLFFNDDGERASFVATRLSDFVAGGGDVNDRVTDLASAQSKGLNCVLLIQVPLKQPKPRFGYGGSVPCAAPMSLAGPQGVARRCAEGCDVEEAVIGHGDIEGPFTEIDGLPIERDPRFPIRITVQLYQATSNGVVDADAIASLAAQIEAIYADARRVGSLVTEADDDRTTAWDDDGTGKREPHDWWDRFWARHTAATGKTREQLMSELATLLGRRPSDGELEAAIRRVFG